jgi:hypothetical protein
MRGKGLRVTSFQEKFQEKFGCELKFSRIRAGLYETLDGNFMIEHLDKIAEFYPGDDYYNLWRVTDCSHEYQWTIWDRHYLTLDDAKVAVIREGYGIY